MDSVFGDSGLSTGVESLMHSGLIQSGVPHLLSGEVRQEDMSFRTGKMPVPLSLLPDEERLVEAIATGDRAAADIARAAGEGFDP